MVLLFCGHAVPPHAPGVALLIEHTVREFAADVQRKAQTRALPSCGIQPDALDAFHRRHHDSQVCQLGGTVVRPPQKNSPRASDAFRLRLHAAPQGLLSVVRRSPARILAIIPDRYVRQEAADGARDLDEAEDPIDGALERLDDAEDLRAKTIRLATSFVAGK